MKNIGNAAFITGNETHLLSTVFFLVPQAFVGSDCCSHYCSTATFMKLITKHTGRGPPQRHHQPSDGPFQQLTIAVLVHSLHPIRATPSTGVRASTSLTSYRSHTTTELHLRRNQSLHLSDQLIPAGLKVSRVRRPAYHLGGWSSS